MTTISENEINIRISLCNVRRLNVEHFSGILSEKDALIEEKILNTWETVVILKIRNAVM